MPRTKTSSRRRGRIIRRLLALPLIAVIAFLGWNYLRPLFSDETITTYASYTAFMGDIETFNSYSGTLSKTYSDAGSGTYRVSAEYVAYSGTKSETITDTSAEVKA